tara:strand:- start:45 stop:209 length:165 start_codon:yes stop_codon:yes gene_type:complete
MRKSALLKGIHLQEMLLSVKFSIKSKHIFNQLRYMIVKVILKKVLTVRYYFVAL